MALPTVFSRNNEMRRHIEYIGASDSGPQAEVAEVRKPSFKAQELRTGWSACGLSWALRCLKLN